jgi:hypothetical protein
MSLSLLHSIFDRSSGYVNPVDMLGNSVNLFIPMKLGSFLCFFRGAVDVMSLYSLYQTAALALVLIRRVAGIAVASGSSEIALFSMRRFPADRTEFHSPKLNFRRFRSRCYIHD